MERTMDDRVRTDERARVAGCSTFWNPVRRCARSSFLRVRKVDNHGARMQASAYFWGRYVYHGERQERDKRLASERSSRVGGDEMEDSRFRNAVSALSFLRQLDLIPRHERYYYT